MRRTLASVAKWAGRGWGLVGLVLAAVVLVEGLYRVTRTSRRRPPDVQVTSQDAPRHPYAGEAWFKGWYEQPAVRAGIVYDPYRAFHKAPARTPSITVDSAGRRLTIQAPGVRGATRRLFLLGGSTMWGYTARDSFTIPSFVAQELHARGIADVEVVNLAQPGYNATQDVISLLLALRDGDVPAAAVFLTTHKDIYAAFQGGRAGGITSEASYAALLERRDPSLADDLGAVARRSALVNRLVPPARASSPPTPTAPDPGLCVDVARQYRELATLTGSMARELGFPVIFLRQPMLASSHKRLSAWERTIARPRHEAVYLRCMAVIDSTMQGVAGVPYLSLASLFDADTSSVFLDEYGYLTEDAGHAVARRIAALVEPSLRSARAASR